jgi:pyridoxal/pyridoxine/pyridoxamine kinase
MPPSEQSHDSVRAVLWQGDCLRLLDQRLLPREETYVDCRTPEDVARVAKARGGEWMISSVPSPAGIGVLHCDGAAARVAETSRIAGRIPNGTGDMLTLRFAGGLVLEYGNEDALADATGATHAVVSKTMEWGGTELSLAACSDLLAKQHSVPVRRIS